MCRGNSFSMVLSLKKLDRNYKPLFTRFLDFSFYELVIIVFFFILLVFILIYGFVNK